MPGSRVELEQALRKRQVEPQEAALWAELLWEHPLLARLLNREVSSRIEGARRLAEAAETGEKALKALGRAQSLKELKMFLDDLEELAKNIRKET